jgi:hypothetical protein
MPRGRQSAAASAAAQHNTQRSTHTAQPHPLGAWRRACHAPRRMGGKFESEPELCINRAAGAQPTRWDWSGVTHRAVPTGVADGSSWSLHVLRHTHRAM